MKAGMEHKKRAKINEENGGYIVKIRVKGNYYSDEKTVFNNLDDAIDFIKIYMAVEKPKVKKNKEKAPH